jgi:predicted transposase YdaD
VSSKPFDATLKDLIETDAAAWVALAGQSCTAARLIDADVSTVTAAGDKVVLVESAGGNFLLDLEPEARPAGDVAGRMHLYGTLLHHRHGLRVRSAAILLRREAEARSLTGTYELNHPDEAEPYLVFRYRVIRVWQLPLEGLLTGGLATLPLAPITDEAAPQLEGVVRRVEERLRGETQSATAVRLLAATNILLGLRYSSDFVAELFRGISGMEESSVYQALIAKGKLLGERELLLEAGSEKFGPPNETTLAALNSITEQDRLKRLARRLLAASTWDEWLSS